MSRTLLCRPGYLHDPSRVSAASSESGLMPAPATASASNAGALVLRTSGVPTAVVSASVVTQTGGAPVGFSISGPPGVAVRWNKTTDTATQWRGYTPIHHLVRVTHPITYDANAEEPGTPRMMPDGYIGMVVASGGGMAFWRVSPAGVGSSVAIGGSTAGFRSDFCILPSGRLIACSFTVSSTVWSYYSDDYGASWSLLANTNFTLSSQVHICVEAIGDTVMLVASDPTAAHKTKIGTSQDGGATFAFVDTGLYLIGARTCVLDGVLFLVTRSATQAWVYRCVPGGGLTDYVATAAATYGLPSIGAADDGSLWVLGWEAGAAGTLRGSFRVSVDGGTTWEDIIESADYPLSFDVTGYGSAGIDGISMGMCGGSMIVVARSRATSGSAKGMHFLYFGEWGSFTDGRFTAGTGYAYKHVYFPIDYPNALGWTKVDFGVGATITNQPYLKIVSTGAANSEYKSSATWWTTNTGGDRKVRVRLRVNSGGSVADNRSRLYLAMDDGVNNQIATLRFSTTAIRAVDTAGTTIGADLAIDLTQWTDLVIVMAHDDPAGSGTLSVWYKQDGSSIYTQWQTRGVIAEAVGLYDRLVFGGNTGGATNWDIAYIGQMETSEGAYLGFANPADLTGRQMSSARDVWMDSGLAIGAINTAAVPGDTYTVGTTYSYGKEQIWRDLRPSRYCASAADGGTWTVTLDAGASNVFGQEIVALLGTNFRTATVSFNATDSWGAPSYTASLSADVWSGTVTGGKGYLTGSGVAWRPGQFKSDGDAHRFFVTVSGTVYEITDNGPTTLYVEDVDLSAIGAGTAAAVFADRMAVRVPKQPYRFARVAVAAQDTADGQYRLGTVIMDRAFDLDTLYENGFVDAVEPNISVTEVDSGYRSLYRRGPRRRTFAIQWGPQNRPSSDFDLRVADFFAALEGSPFLLWRDAADATSIGLYTYVGAVTMPNVLGEHEMALTRIDQLTLEEFW